MNCLFVKPMSFIKKKKILLGSRLQRSQKFGWAAGKSAQFANDLEFTDDEYLKQQMTKLFSLRLNYLTWNSNTKKLYIARPTWHKISGVLKLKESMLVAVGEAVFIYIPKRTVTIQVAKWVRTSHDNQAYVAMPTAGNNRTLTGYLLI